MTINILGTLKDPLGNVLPNTIIRFTSLNHLTGSHGEYTTDANGAYNFNLIIGTYRVEGNYLGDELHELGTVILDENTPSPTNIPDLILIGSPVTPPIIIDTDVNWATLFANVKSLGTLTNSQYQVRNGDNYTSEVKELWEAPTAVMTDESLESSTLNAKMISQVRTYEDDNLNQATTITHEGDVEGINTYSSLEAFKASNGKEELRNTTILTGTKGVIENTKEITDLKLSTKESISYGSSSIQGTVVADESSFSNSTVATVGGSTHQSIQGYSPTHLGSIHPETSQTANLSLTEVINNVTHTAEITDKKVLAISTDELASALHKAGVRVYTKEAFQQLTIDDSGTSEHIIQADNHIIQDDAGNPLADFNTVTNTVTINGSLNIGNPTDFKGDSGDVNDFVYQYSIDDGVTDPYHDNYDPMHPDRWRRQHKTVNGSLVGGWETGVYFNAKDGADGDSYFNQYMYSTDDASKLLNSWHTEYITGDDWRRWRVIENGLPVTSTHGFYGPENGWWEERMKGLDGPAGWIADVQYQYSVNNLPPWHNDFITGDIFRRERVSWYGSSEDFLLKEDPVTPSTPVLEGTWTSGAQIVPISGVDYDNKYFTVMMYKRSNVDLVEDEPGTVTFDFTTTLISPSTSNGWTTIIPTGEEDIWLAVGTAHSLNNTDTVDDWVVEKSVAGGYKSAVAWYYRVEASLTAITNADLPTVPLTYDFLTGKVTTSSAGWSPTIPTNTLEGGKLLVTFNTALVKVSEWEDTLDVSDWETPVVLTQNGTDADTGNSKSFVFKNSISIPTTPSGGDFSTSPLGWTDDPVNPPIGETVWVSSSAFTYVDGSWSAASWSSPARYSGEIGASGADSGRFTSFIYKNASTSPGVPAGGSFNGTLEVLPVGWADSSNSPPTNQFIWVSTTTYTYNDPLNAWSNNGWAAPSKFSGEIGATGEDGSGWYYKQDTSTAWFSNTDTVNWVGYPGSIVTAFNTIAGRAPINGDIFVLSNTAGTHSDTGMYDDGLNRFNAITQLISGNVLIDGTLNATKIKSNSITAAQIQGNTITGTEISASSRIIVGSGNNLAGMNGLDSGSYNGYRFWAGSATPASSNFNVTSNGTLYAQSAYIRGNIEADSIKANSLDIIETVNLQGNAVTIMQGISGEGDQILTFNHGHFESSTMILTAQGYYSQLTIPGNPISAATVNIELDGSVVATFKCDGGKTYVITAVVPITPGTHTLKIVHVQGTSILNAGTISSITALAGKR